MTVLQPPPLEADVLTVFWNAVGPDNRLDLLHWTLTIRVRPVHGQTPGQMRVAFEQLKPPIADPRCFSCYHHDRQLAWHHIVTIANGGSNSPRNRVTLCYDCHRRLHPWLEEPRSKSAWTSVGELVEQLLNDDEKKDAG